VKRGAAVSIRASNGAANGDDDRHRQDKVQSLEARTNKLSSASSIAEPKTSCEGLEGPSSGRTVAPARAPGRRRQCQRPGPSRRRTTRSDESKGSKRCRRSAAEANDQTLHIQSTGITTSPDRGGKLDLASSVPVAVPGGAPVVILGEGNSRRIALIIRRRRSQASGWRRVLPRRRSFARGSRDLASAR